MTKDKDKKGTKVQMSRKSGPILTKRGKDVYVKGRFRIMGYFIRVHTDRKQQEQETNTEGRRWTPGGFRT